MEQNPLTIRAAELNRLPLAERRRILELQAENHLKLKAEATRRATKVIAILLKEIEDFENLWRQTDTMNQDDILYSIEETIQKDADEAREKVAPLVP